MVIPMLEEREWPELQKALSEGIKNVQRERQEQSKTLDELGPIASRFRNALEVYERITGFKETNPNALWHHRVSLYGPPCETCGKPLRTPLAKLCAACGTRRTFEEKN